MIDPDVAMYEGGAITADHLVARCLNRVDPEEPASVLGSLPWEILDRMLVYIDKSQSGRMISNQGALPAVAQVEAARVWIERARAAPLADRGR